MRVSAWCAESAHARSRHTSKTGTASAPRVARVPSGERETPGVCCQWAKEPPTTAMSHRTGARRKRSLCWADGLGDLLHPWRSYTRYYIILFHAAALRRDRAATMASVRHSCRVGAACTVFVLCCVLQCTAFAAVTAHTPCQHRSNSGACAPLLRGAGERAAASTTSGVMTVLFLPLDERFTTRDAFLHLALTTTFQVISPPAEILPHHKVPANLTALDAWMKTNMPRADAAIISAE